MRGEDLLKQFSVKPDAQKLYASFKSKCRRGSATRSKKINVNYSIFFFNLNKNKFEFISIKFGNKYSCRTIVYFIRVILYNISLSLLSSETFKLQFLLNIFGIIGYYRFSRERFTHRNY